MNINTLRIIQVLLLLLGKAKQNRSGPAHTSESCCFRAIHNNHAGRLSLVIFMMTAVNANTPNVFFTLEKQPKVMGGGGEGGFILETRRPKSGNSYAYVPMASKTKAPSSSATQARASQMEGGDTFKWRPDNGINAISTLRPSLDAPSLSSHNLTIVIQPINSISIHQRITARKLKRKEQKTKRDKCGRYTNQPAVDAGLILPL